MAYGKIFKAGGGLRTWLRRMLQWTSKFKVLSKDSLRKVLTSKVKSLIYKSGTSQENVSEVAHLPKHENAILYGYLQRNSMLSKGKSEAYHFNPAIRHNFF